MKNAGYEASLELGKTYEVVSQTIVGLVGKSPEQWLRVIDESGDSYFYPASFFEQ